MSEIFLNLCAMEQNEILLAGAAALGRSPAVLEKDVWVCWALQQVFNIADRPRMAFKGGTSLSKVFNAIERFSEDIDITIDYRDLGASFDPFAASVTNNRRKQFNLDLTTQMRDYVASKMRPHLEARLKADMARGGAGIRIGDDGDKIWIDYPSSLGEGPGYVPNSVLIEFGGRNITEPNSPHLIRPYLIDVSRGLDFPEALPDVLAPERTFWEKATLIHVACNRGQLKDNADRLSRHWSDLATLAQQDIGKRAVTNRELLLDVVKHKEVFFPASYANYPACANQAIRLVPNEQLRSALAADYRKMIDAGMFFGDAHEFEEILATLSTLEKKINEK